MSKRRDAIDAIRDAQELIFEAIEKLEWAVREADDRHANAYIVDQLKVLAGNQHGFLASDYNLDKWMSDLEGNDEEGDDSDD